MSFNDTAVIANAYHHAALHLESPRVLTDSLVGHGSLNLLCHAPDGSRRAGAVCHSDNHFTRVVKMLSLHDLELAQLTGRMIRVLIDVLLPALIEQIDLG